YAGWSASDPVGGGGSSSPGNNRDVYCPRIPFLQRCAAAQLAAVLSCGMAAGAFNGYPADDQPGRLPAGIEAYACEADCVCPRGGNFNRKIPEGSGRLRRDTGKIGLRAGGFSDSDCGGNE